MPMRRGIRTLKRYAVILSIPAVVAAVSWYVLIRPLNRPLPIWAGGPVTEPPSVSFWDLGGGVFRPDVKPFPLIVVWPDGTVVKRVPHPESGVLIATGAREDGDCQRYKGDTVRVFRTDPAQVQALLKGAEEDGWFRPPRADISDLYVVTDGPFLGMRLSMDASTSRARAYHGRDEWLSDEHLPLPAPGSYQFVTMWNSVRERIGRLPLTEVGAYSGYPPLDYDPQNPVYRLAETKPGPGLFDRMRAGFRWLWSLLP